MALRLLSTCFAICIAGSLVAAQTTTSSTTDDGGSTIVITATTGTPPPVVTFTADQNTALTGVTAITTSSSTTYYPFGWFWVPIPPPTGLPPVLPSIPTSYVPTRRETPKTSDPGCKSTSTPTVTVLVTYTTDPKGTVQIVTSSNKPVNLPATCVAPAKTTTTTATYTPNLLLGGFPSPGVGPPKVLPALADSTLQYFIDMFKKDGVDSSDQIKPVECSDTTYDKAIPSAVAFVKGLSPNFCADWSAKPTAKLDKSYTARDVKTKKMRRTIKGRTPPPQDLTPSSYPNWKVDFSWQPGDVSDDCKSQDYCSKQLSAVLTGCEGYSLADAYKSGNIEDGCGIFQYTVTPPPPPKPTNQATCGITSWDHLGVKVTTPDGSGFIGNTDGFYGTAFADWPTSTFKAAADSYCKSGKKYTYDRTQKPNPVYSSEWYWINSDQQDPDTKENTICYDDRIDLWESQFVPKSDLKCTGDGKGRFKSNSRLLLSVIPSPNQSGCSEWKDDVYEVPSGDECYANFQQVIDGCLSTDGKGRMGVYKTSSSENGCWDYWMIGTALD